MDRLISSGTGNVMKQKILFVTYAAHGGGAERNLQLILKNLDRRKFEPHLCVFSSTGKEAEVIPADVPFYILRTNLRPASIFLAYKLFKLLRELRPQKVFSILWSVNLISLITALTAGIPVIINETSVTSESIKRYSFPAARKKLISLLYKRAEAVIAIADFVKNDLAANFRIPEEKIITVHNGVPVADIEKACLEYKIEPQDYIFSCGSLTWWKNHELLIKAAARLKGIPVVIVGKGPLEGRLLEKAKSAGVELILPGYAENPYPYFRNAAVFVLTSAYEGLGNVILEAMACKVPVITVDCPGGVREIVEDGKTGLLVPQNDPEALEEAIRKLRSDRALAQKLAGNAYAGLVNNFSFDKMLAEYEKILSALPPEPGR